MTPLTPLTPLPLAADFPAATRDDWMSLVARVLKGAPFEKLISETYDGLRIAPLSPRAKNAAVLPGRAAGAPWRIMQRVDHPDAKAANALALTDLENGATGLTLIFANSSAARGFGLAPALSVIEQALDGVFLDAGVAIDIDAGADAALVAGHVASLVAARKLESATLDIQFGFDPIGAAALAGGVAAPDINELGARVARLRALGFGGPFASADGRIVHDAGGSEVQELAYVLASGVAYLRALEAAGISLEDARRMIAMRLSADADQFLTMAKFRTLRKLWALVEQGCGLDPARLVIAADTAWRMLTQRDPHVNMLRATVATFAAGLGGATSLCVLPHTLALGLPDAHARRIARNTQLVLLEESNLFRVSDPAAGAGGIEDLTAQLCDAAWTLFQEIEKAGGIVAALRANMLQTKVAAVRDARAAKIGKRRDVLTGASEFPNLDEAPENVLAKAPASTAQSELSAFAPLRLAAPFEALRDRSDAILAQRGRRPRVLLVTLGTPADFTARATFAKSFFEIGGIAAVDAGLSSPLPASGERSTPQVSGEGLKTGVATSTSNNVGHPPHPTPLPASGARDQTETAANLGAFLNIYPAADLVCLCSSDTVYAAQAVAATRALHAAGAKPIYLAGRPDDLERDLRAAGVSGFIYAGCNALATLRDVYDRMDDRSESLT